MLENDRMDKTRVPGPARVDLTSDVARKVAEAADQRRRDDRQDELTLNETGVARLVHQSNRAQREFLLSRLQSAHGNSVVQRILANPQRRTGPLLASSREGRTVQRVGPAAVAGAIELGTAVFSAGAPLLLSGNFSVEANTLSYVHESTPADAQWRRASTSFTIYAHHPRVGWGTQHFEFAVSFEYNKYDLRDLRILGLQSASSDMITSSFQIKFDGHDYSGKNESVAVIHYQITGVWNPHGAGVASFGGILEIDANGNGSIKISSENDWVWPGNWGARTDERLAGPQTVTREAPPVLHLHFIGFVPGKDQITEEGERSLLGWIDSLPPNARGEIEAGRLPISIEGHASTTQPGPANRLLSRQRASKVREIIADIAGSNVAFNIRALGEYRAGTPDQVEDENERMVVVSAVYSGQKKDAGDGANEGK